MRTNGLMILIVTIVAMAACSKNNSHVEFPSREAETAFQTKYPGASSVEWERAGVFQKVEFVLNAVEYDAWYTASGIWLQTEYTMAYANVPDAVKENASNDINYPADSWIPQNSVDVVDRLNYPLWYEVELKKGSEEVFEWSDAEAFRHYVATEDMDWDELPAAIRSFLSSRYANAWVTEGMQLSDGSYVVYLLSGNEPKQVYFTSSQEWSYTEWPVSPGTLPQEVQTVLGGEAYKNYSIKSVEYQQYADKAYYHIVLENTNLPGNQTIWINIDSQGNMV